MGHSSILEKIEQLSPSSRTPPRPLVCYGHKAAEVAEMAHSQAISLSARLGLSLASPLDPHSVSPECLNLALIDCSTLDASVGLADWHRVIMGIEAGMPPFIAVFTRLNLLGAADKLLATGMAFDATGNTQCLFASSAESLSDLLEGLRETLPCCLLSRVDFCSPGQCGAERDLRALSVLLNEVLMPRRGLSSNSVPSRKASAR